MLFHFIKKPISFFVFCLLFVIPSLAVSTRTQTGLTKALADSRYMGTSGGTITGDMTIEGSLFVNDSQLDSESFQVMTRTTEIITVEVDVTGNDTTGDGSAGAPFATWQKSFDETPNILNHDIYINLSAGTFSESNPIIAKLSTDSEEVTRRIWITGAVNEINATATADGGSITTLTDTGAFAGQDFSSGAYFLRLLSGPNYLDLTTAPQFSNDFPIKSNTDDVLTLDCQLASALDGTSTYQIITNATTLEGADTVYDYGLILKQSKNIEVNIRNVDFTDSYFGINNYSDVWVNSCRFIEGTNGYSGVYLQEGATAIVDKSFFTGTWSNGDVGIKKFGFAAVRQNSFGTGTRAIDAEGAGAHAFFYGNYVHDKVNGVVASWGGFIETPSNVNVGNIIDDCSDSAMYATYGSTIILNRASGDGNNIVAETAGSGNVQYDSGNFTNTTTQLNLFNDTAGLITDDDTGISYVGGVYEIQSGGLDVTGFVTAESIESSGAITDGTSVMSGGTFELGHASDTTLSRTGAGDIAVEGNGVYRAGGTDVAIGDGGTGVGSWTDGQLLVGNTTGNTAALATLTGTANQVSVANGASSITLSTPQDIATSSSPTFAGVSWAGSNNSELVLQTVSEVITIPALSSTANGTISIPADSVIVSFAYYVTDGTDMAATNMDIGDTAGSAFAFALDQGVTTGTSGNAWDSGSSYLDFGFHFVGGSSITPNVALDNNLPVGDDFSVRVVFWYYTTTPPTS